MPEMDMPLYATQTLQAFSRMVFSDTDEYDLNAILSLDLRELSFIMPIKDRLNDKLLKLGFDFDPNVEQRKKESLTALVRRMAKEHGFDIKNNCREDAVFGINRLNDWLNGINDPGLNQKSQGSSSVIYKFCAILGLNHSQCEQLISKVFLRPAFNFSNPDEILFSVLSKRGQDKNIDKPDWYHAAMKFKSKGGIEGISPDFAPYFEGENEWLEKYYQALETPNYGTDAAQKEIAHLVMRCLKASVMEDLRYYYNVDSAKYRNLLKQLFDISAPPKRHDDKPQWYSSATMNAIDPLKVYRKGTIVNLFRRIERGIAFDIADREEPRAFVPPDSLSYLEMMLYRRRADYLTRSVKINYPDAASLKKALGGTYEKIEKTLRNADAEDEHSFETCNIPQQKMRKLLIILDFYSYYQEQKLSASKLSDPATYSDPYNNLNLDALRRTRSVSSLYASVPFIKECNFRLAKAGFNPLYLRNPFDLVIIAASISAHPLERFREIIADLGIHEEN